MDLYVAIALTVSGTFVLAGLLSLLIADPSPFLQARRRQLLVLGVVLLVLDAALSVGLYAAVRWPMRQGLLGPYLPGTVPLVTAFHLGLLCVTLGVCAWALLRPSDMTQVLLIDGESPFGCLLSVTLMVACPILACFSGTSIGAAAVSGLIIGLGLWQGTFSYAVPFKWGLIPVVLGAVVIYWGALILLTVGGLG